jgi:hypothetical protein
LPWFIAKGEFLRSKKVYLDGRFKASWSLARAYNQPMNQELKDISNIDHLSEEFFKRAGVDYDENVRRGKIMIAITGEINERIKD